MDLLREILRSLNEGNLYMNIECKYLFVGKKPQLSVLNGTIYKYQQGTSELHRRHPQGDATT